MVFGLFVLVGGPIGWWGRFFYLFSYLHRGGLLVVWYHDYSPSKMKTITRFFYWNNGVAYIGRLDGRRNKRQIQRALLPLRTGCAKVRGIQYADVPL